MIRSLSPDELHLVRDLRRQLHDHHAVLPCPPGYRVREFAPAWEEWHVAAQAVVAEGRGVVFVHGDDETAPDGMAYLHDLDPASLLRPVLAPTGPHVELSTLVVADTARRGGIGGALTDAGADWARARGAVAVQIRVRGTNVDARRFYVRRGAEPTFDGLVVAV